MTYSTSYGAERENGMNIHRKCTKFKCKLTENFASVANVKVCILKFLASSHIKLQIISEND